MTLLPIVGRELRVASRQPGTYWARVIAAGLAIVAAGGFLAVWTAASNMGGGNMGQILFGILRWLCFIFVCSTGLFLTSDSLSEEKRDGTLGLLFLTDLRGYDVVLGKLAATSLRSFYGLLAFFPVLGITLLAGGVSGREFWQTMLALCNALFFSLAAGVFVSSISRDTLKAMTGVLVVCALAMGLPAILDAWLFQWGPFQSDAFFLFSSPLYAFLIAGGRNSQNFWAALLLPHLLGWAMLGLASYFVPRTWQEKSCHTQARWSLRRWRFASYGQRRGSLEYNPVVWLAGRDQWLIRCAQLVFLTFGGWAAYAWLKQGTRGIADEISGIQTLLIVTLYLWIAAQSVRFISDAKRTGSLELILCTPVTIAQIIKGQWLALLRMLWLPVLVVITIEAAQHFERLDQLGPNSNSELEIYHLLAGVSGTAMFVTGLLALGWFGMLMGLRSRKTGLAVLKAIGFVQLLPWLVLTILQSLLIMAAVSAGLPFYGGILISTALGLAKDAFFIIYARRRLYATFRDSIIQSPETVPPVPAPEPLRVDPKLPPVLPA